MLAQFFYISASDDVGLEVSNGEKFKYRVYDTMLELIALTELLIDYDVYCPVPSYLVLIKKKYKHK